VAWGSPGQPGDGCIWLYKSVVLDIRGHDVYKKVWTPFVGEVLLMEQEDHNPENCFTVTMLKSGEIVSHVLHEISRIVWYFEIH